MDWIILIVTLGILAETSFLMITRKKPTRGGSRKIYVDTSALIDGRILNIARTGFINDELIILKSVLRELQLLADGKDSERRNRARAGLNNVAELERVIEVNTEVVDDGDGKKKVDDELLKFAKENRGAILTIDYNLIKVAKAEKIATLNVNDLALAVKSEFAPGERIEVRIAEKGTNRGQGVGHLPDGTMVVVDKAAGRIGQTVTAECLRFRETPAGRMIFAKLVKSQN